MSLLTSTNERSDGNFFFAPQPPNITLIPGVATIGTITNSNTGAQADLSYDFYAGNNYYIQSSLQVGKTSTSNNGSEYIVVSIYPPGNDSGVISFTNTNFNTALTGTIQEITLNGIVNIQSNASALRLAVGLVGTAPAGTSYIFTNPHTTNNVIQVL